MVQRTQASSRLVATLCSGALVATLSACGSSEENPHGNRNSGVIIGAISGAAIGNATAHNDRKTGTIVGAIVGGLAGGAIGAELDRQEAELRAELDSRIRIENTGSSLILSMPNDITFDFDSYEVRPELRDDLQSVAASLHKYPNSTTQVIGHTDNVGTATYNLGLSQQRADAVANVLIRNGTSPSRLKTIPRGEDQPIDSNLTDAGRARNRRVEIVIIPSQSQA